MLNTDFTFTAHDIDAFARDGFLIAQRVLDDALVDRLRARFDALYQGEFETGVRPDEVNWRAGESDPALTRQICNAWKADRAIARVVLDAGIGEAIARLANWSGARVIQDNVLWKPPGAGALGMHQDTAYLAWYAPRAMLSCWLALDDASAAGGAVQFARGSHRWPRAQQPPGEFHAPDDYTAALYAAARADGREVELVAAEVERGVAVFHHGDVWHGSPPNRSAAHRRALVVHGGPADARFNPAGFAEGNGPIYSRYRRLTDNTMDENHFPITWRADGHRSAGLDAFVAGG